MRPLGPVRQVGHLVAAVAGLVTAAPVYFWPIIAPSPSHTITSDLSAYTYPWRRYVTQELFAGRLPQWTPYVGFGFPLLADIEGSPQLASVGGPPGIECMRFLGAAG